MAVRPIDANALARRIRDYMDDFPNAATRLAACRVILSMLGDENQTPTLTQPNEPLVTGFDVVDTKTGEYPDLERIALKEDWAKHLMYCDMEGFAIEEDGTLLLLDECGRQACCPAGRFKIIHPEEGDDEDGTD